MNAQNMESSAHSGNIAFVTVIQSGASKALSQTWAPVEAGPAAEAVTAVTRRHLEDLALCGSWVWVA